MDIKKWFTRTDVGVGSNADELITASRKEQKNRPTIGGKADTPRQHKLDQEISPPPGSDNVNINKFHEDAAKDK